MKERIKSILEMKSADRVLGFSGLGFNNGRLASQNMEDIERFNLPLDQISQIIEVALNSPDPDSSLSFLERFLSASLEAGINISHFTEHLGMLITILGSSEFLSSILIRRPALGIDLMHSPYLHVEKASSVMKEELREKMTNISDYEGLLSILRVYKQKEMLRIGIKDLLGYAPVEGITAELSSLASATLDTAYIFCLDLLKKDYGTPYLRAHNGTLMESSFTVLGMGKLGGNELNFSSDIDLIYLYTSDEGGTVGGIRSFTIYEFYCKLAELLTRALSSNTSDGFVFRVDLRLRPEGQNGPVVNSIRSAEIYYESWGETWERSAMLKARPVAGDIALGEKFLKDIEPFIYRKYLDFSTIDDIKEMKLKIDRELALKPGMWDVKLGSGGIREIEFLVQATQLIHAGKDSSIRERNTLKSLQNLHKRGLLSGNNYEALTTSYRFLRTVEHRIQIESERQTHRLPAKSEDLKRLAKRCGFKDMDGFKKALSFHSSSVERMYDSIFHEPSRKLDAIPHEAAYLFSNDVERDEIMEKLASMGFADPKRAYLRLQTLKEAGPLFRLTQRSRTSMRRLAPHLFLEASRSPDPDMALANLDRFLNAVGGKGSFYSLLATNLKVVRLLTALFGTSDFLSQFLIGHPELLDTLLKADTVTLVKSKEELRTEMDAALGVADGYEEILDSVRRFRNIELIRIGINDIAEAINLTDVADQLTSLAELSIELALRMADKEIRSRYGAPLLPDGREAAISVFGMGKLGSREMNYSSDLDLIFIYSGGGETKGPRVITNQEYFAKMAQRVISFITLQTREGYLYKVDARLRPSGSAGALVSSLDAFRRYHSEHARVWERQAMIKARAVAGDIELGEQTAREITSFVYDRGIDKEGREEMVRLRERMEKELAKEGPQIYNVKTGRGGIADIDYTVQFLQLKHGGQMRELRKSATVEALHSLFDKNLLTFEDFSTLKEAYQFLMKAETRLRILHNISTDQMELAPEKLMKLAKRLGYSAKGTHTPQDLFLADYHRHTERVREIYNRRVNT